jgi:hypothetical protein
VSQGDQLVSRPLVIGEREMSDEDFDAADEMSDEDDEEKWWIFRRAMGKSLASIPAERPRMIGIKRRIGTQTS